MHGPDPDDVSSNPNPGRSIGELIDARLSRRDAVKSLAAGAAAVLVAPRLAAAGSGSQEPAGPSTLTFAEVRNVIPEKDCGIPAGYRADVLIRWGDPVLGDAPAFEPHALTADAQGKQFGFNNDFIGFLPLPYGSSSSTRGLLCVNHEFTCPELMWSGRADGRGMDREQVGVEMEAHGHSIVEIERIDGRWRVAAASAFNRRISATTAMRVSGPAAGHRRLRTKGDPSGRKVLGTINNCAGGVTPWGTVLIAEENFNYYFLGDVARTGTEERNHQRYGLGFTYNFWGDHVARFDLDREPNEPNRFGWVVEIDPFDPFSVPVKRTSLGRLKHEGAETIVNHDGRLVVYMGDDQRFDYVYKWVSDQPVAIDDRKANRDLLDQGTLFVAHFDEDGTVHWRPLVFGAGPLTPANDFHSQADVLIETRRAADLLGATPMDRPEDVATNPKTGKVYVMLTNNTARTADRIDGGNPRGPNPSGHVLELVPHEVDGALDHAALTATWNVFLQAGDPKDAAAGARYHPETSTDGWFHAPDNCAFDSRGRIYIATDQGSGQATTGVPDGLRVADTEGPGRALTRLLFTCPPGAELCGPCLTPDDRTLFVAVQHPGEGTHPDQADHLSTFDDPCTRWPDYDPKVPPRPSVLALTRDDDRPIGT